MIRLTRSGSLVTVAAVITVVAGRLLGLDEVMVLGGGGLLAVFLAPLWLAQPDLAVEIVVEPARVPEHAPASASVTFTNVGPRRARSFDARVAVASMTTYEASLEAIPRGEVRQIRVALTTQRRGIYWVGAISTVRTDPFGLVQRVTRIDVPARRLVVLPTVTRVAAAVAGHDNDPLAAPSRASARSQAGEEFATLRAYAAGDDLRRVHWPSSARQDDLVVRREERPLQRSCTVVVDTRAASHRADSLEPLVRAAASIVAASARRGDMFRLRTTTGFDGGPGTGRQHLIAVFDELAALSTAQPGLAATATHRRPGPDQGTVVLLTTPWASNPPAARAARGHLRLAITDDEDFAAQWLRLVGPAFGSGRGARHGSAWSRPRGRVRGKR